MHVRVCSGRSTPGPGEKNADCLVAFDWLLGWLRKTPGPADDDLILAGDQALPAKDVPILAAALAADANMLVTGDHRHFGHLFGRAIRNTSVMRLADTLETLLSEHGRGG